MIQVPRDEDPAAVQALTKKNKKGKTEHDRVKAFFTKQANRQKPFPFKAYKAQEVKDALQQKFHGKCAYCESKYLATAPMDVEHYRPKGAITINGELVKPGYYWMAAEWENLLPSCIDCNRARIHPFEDEAIEPHLAGKANLFPIADEALRWNDGDQACNEERLLLHPYLDDPDQCLTFTDDGLILPKENASGDMRRMGKESIEVYALKRLGLHQQRRARLVFIRDQMAEVEKQLRRLDETPDDDRSLADLKEALMKLERFTREEEEYAGMARQVIGRFRQMYEAR